MPSISNTTARRLRHASGYIGLQMLNEASDELESIEVQDRLSPEVMDVRCDLYMAAKQWDLLVAVAKELARLKPAEEKGWIHWAFALRELQRVPEAKAVLLTADPAHGATCAVLHFNLACYHCLLGELDAAKTRLRRACKMSAELKSDALEDPDLEAIWGDVSAVE